MACAIAAIKGKKEATTSGQFLNASASINNN
jgi:hypothetical protein